MEMYRQTALAVMSAALIFATLVSAQSPAESASCPEFAPGTLCSSGTPYCGDDCDNTPFCPTTCWTTDSGPAWSGAGESSQTSLLYCATGTYANCHFSGPPWATGTNPDNIPLPCKLSADGKMADCKCQVFEGPSYVNMYGIMNLGVYYETVEVCGSDGSQCQNAETCPPGTTGECDGEVPPVCKYVAGQDPTDPGTSLIPGAELISTYGFAMQDDYPQGSDPTTCENSVIAGCMTAPCRYEKGDMKSPSGARYAQCACPTSFQESFTLSQSNQKCDIGKDYVWE